MPSGDATPHHSTEMHKSIVEKIPPSRRSNFAAFYLKDTKLHSKLVMIDDEFVSIGSANAWDRSMTGDESDLNVALVAPGGQASPIADLRVRLWQEHFRMADNRASAVTVRNLDIAFGFFDSGWGHGRPSHVRDGILRRMEPAPATSSLLPPGWENWRNGDEREIARQIAARSAGARD